jgi:GNAT superfamily N-acetyltransferase
VTLSIHFRQASANDSNELMKLYHDAYIENIKLGFPASAATVKEAEIQQWIEKAFVYVATLDDRIVASVRLIYREEWNSLVLSRLGVLSEWKGHGIASRLMEYVEKEAFNKGWTKIRLTTPATHPYLPNMYEKRGYIKIGIREFDDLPYKEVIMEKCLLEGE